MGILVPVSPNMSFEIDDAFGDFNSEVVFDMLRFVDENFSESLGLAPFSSTSCIISYNHALDVPMCSRHGDFHHIYLRLEGDYWCQWVFQFAHEYCHHLIDGDLSGDITGLVWFEECVCELSSMYHLQSLACLRGHIPESLPRHYVPSLRDYLEKRISLGVAFASDATSRGLLYGWGSILQEPKYQREYYITIAARMLPLFVENPRLWKMILHFGDMREWRSMGDLFAHLQDTADDSYSVSLGKLYDLLF